ncbi:MAG TPA: TonB-dependent receptor [Bacteroidota bacterium]|nr:TonB-dependent receptor [Bacteroidota bacterium]
MHRCIFVFGFFFATTAMFGQENSDSVRYHLAPVTITAMRTPEGWLSVPQAINVLEKKSMEQKKGYGLDEILLTVPGVLAQSRNGNQDIRLSIRGFGARGAGARSNAATTRGIRVLIDGFPETEPDGRTSFDLVDIGGAGSVEVIRSNSSATWGNAAGGVLNIISNTMFDKAFATFRAEGGDFGFRKQSLYAGSAMGAGKFFFSLNNTISDGWRAHSGSSQLLLNTGVVSPLGESTRLGVYVAATSNFFRIPGPLTEAQFNANPQQANATLVTRDERRNNRLGRIGISLAHDLDEHLTLATSVYASPKYLQRSERNRFRDFNRYHIGGNGLMTGKWTLSPEARMTAIFGVDEAYQDGAIHFYNLTANGDRGTTLIANKREGANNLGAFLQDELVINENLSLIAGGRYDNISYYYDDYITPSLNDQKSFEHFTPKGGVNYRLSSNWSIYASVGGGVEVPAGNEVDPSPTFGTDTVRLINPLLEPITSTTYEAGMKHIAIPVDGGMLTAASFDLALYWLEVRNDIIPYSGGAFYFTAGRTHRYGIEIGGQAALSNGLSFSTALTFSRNTYDDYKIDSVHYGNAGKFADLKDKDMSGVPGSIYNVDVKYVPRWLDVMYVKFGVHGVGSYFADDMNQFTVPSYTVSDLGFGFDKLSLEGGKFSLSGFFLVNNVFDRTYAASAWINPDLVGGVPVFLEPGLPRNFIGAMSLGWNL